MERVTPFLVGAMFVVIGNVMPRARPNWLFGIRTPWTLSNDRVWERTHRLGGLLFVIAGVLLMIAAFAIPSAFLPAVVIGVVVAAVVPVVYSYVTWRKESNHARTQGLALFLALALPLQAQQPERATFYLIVGTDTLTIERSERTAADLRLELFDRKSHSRIGFVGKLTPEALVESAAMSIFVNPVDTAPALRAGVRFLGDSIGVDRGRGTNWVRVGAGALPGMNVSAALLEQSLLRARAIGGDSVTIPVMSLPNGPAIPVTIIRRGPTSATARIGGVTLAATLSADGSLLGAVIPSQNARYSRGPATTGPFPGLKSFAPPNGAPYSAQEVSIRTPGGLTLRGTLTLPQRAAGARLPAIVTITGSGSQDRDESPPTLKAYRLYYQVADTLGRRGIAVLRLDDRGAGSDVGPATATTADFANDIRAAVAYLRTRPEIDPARIGLVGHSEGGTIAPMVASSDSGIAGVVILGGTVSPGRDLVAFQQRYIVDSVAHLMGQRRDAALAQYARNTDSVAAAVPWWKFFLEYDGTAAAHRMRAPVLILHGEKDYQVPVIEAEKTASAFRAGGNPDVSMRVFPGMNHLFLPDAGLGFSYEKLPSFVVTPEVLGAIADWLAARLIR
jgi:dienelactone hydrolase